MRAKECLSCDRFMPPIANYLPFGNPAFRMWPLGPSCFDGIRTRIATDDASYLWKTKPCCGYDAGKAVPFRPLRCRPAPRPSFHSAPIWQRAGGGVDIVFASWVRKWALQRLRVPVMKRTYRGIVPFPADVRTGSGGVDAVTSAGAFAGVRTRTGQFLRLLPLPVGLRKHVRIPPLRGRNIRTVHNRSGHSCRILTLMLAVDAHTTA